MESKVSEIDFSLSQPILRRSKRIPKLKSFDDNEIYISTARVKIRHDSREQIYKGKVSDITESFESDGEIHQFARKSSRSPVFNSLNNSITVKRSESCPRLGRNTDSLSNSAVMQMADGKRKKADNRTNKGDSLVPINTCFPSLK